jgi:hypothetical protein
MLAVVLEGPDALESMAMAQDALLEEEFRSCLLHDRLTLLRLDRNDLHLEISGHSHACVVVLQCSHHVTACSNFNGHSLLLVDSPCFAVPDEMAHMLGKCGDFEFISRFGFWPRWQNNAVLIPALAQLMKKCIGRNRMPFCKQSFKQRLE